MEQTDFSKDSSETTFSWEKTNTELHLNTALLLSIDNEDSFNSSDYSFHDAYTSLQDEDNEKQINEHELLSNTESTHYLVLPDNNMSSKVQKNFENLEVRSSSKSERDGKEQIDKKIEESCNKVNDEKEFMEISKNLPLKDLLKYLFDKTFGKISKQTDHSASSKSQDQFNVNAHKNETSFNEKCISNTDRWNVKNSETICTNYVSSNQKLFTIVEDSNDSDVLSRVNSSTINSSGRYISIIASLMDQANSQKCNSTKNELSVKNTATENKLCFNDSKDIEIGDVEEDSVDGKTQWLNDTFEKYAVSLSSFSYEDEEFNIDSKVTHESNIHSDNNTNTPSNTTTNWKEQLNNTEMDENLNPSLICGEYKKKSNRRSLSLPELCPLHINDPEASNDVREKQSEKTPKFVVHAFLNLQRSLSAKKKLFLKTDSQRKSNIFSRKLRKTSVPIDSPLSRKHLASPTDRCIIYSPIKPVKYLTAMFAEKANKNTGNVAKSRIKYRKKSPTIPNVTITRPSPARNV